jgi:prepilin-type N-terminal cleavage/methylation domain-containing protein
MNPKGFTIIELIIVMVLLGILTISISLGTNRIGSIAMAAQAAQVAQDIRYTQSLAMAQHQSFRIYFCNPNNTSDYTVYQILRDSDGSAVINPTTGTSNPTDLQTGIRFSNCSLSGRRLVFDSQGTPYEGTSSSPFTNNETVTLSVDTSAGGCSGGSCGGTNPGCTITITPNTGYVSVACSG